MNRVGEMRKGRGGATRACVALLMAAGLTLAACSSDRNGAVSTSTTAPATHTGSGEPTTAAPTTDPGTSGPPTSETATSETATSAPTTTPAATDPATTSPLEAPAGDAFYVPPSPLPGSKPGDLIWFAPATNGPAGMTSYRMLYRSESVAGEAIAVSGVVVFAPTLAGPDAPILSYGHGTTGLGDQCAPSRLGGSFADSGYVSVAQQAGLVYVATDYEGLGTPGDHPYLMGLSEGRGILDAARAANQIPGVPIDDASKVIIAGHSQGGEAALSAAELAGSYAPELDVRGVVGVAPPGELALVVKTLSTGPLNGFLPMVLSGARALDPQLDMSLAANADALAIIDDVSSMCGDAPFQRVAGLDAAASGFTDPGADPAWSALLVANSPGHVASSVPVLIVHGDADSTVPVGLSGLVQQAGCSQGQTIQRNIYPGANHGSVLTASHDDVIAWIGQRLAGTSPAPSNCP